MLELESFRTLSEVSAALTGFVGVILVIRSRNEPLPRLQLIGFLQNSLGVLMFSLLAVFLVETFSPDPIMWRSLCGALAIFHLVIMINYIITQRGLLKMSIVQKTITFCSVPIIVLKLLAATGILVGFAASIFHLGLLWHLFIGVYIFSQILLMTNQDIDTTSDV